MPTFTDNVLVSAPLEVVFAFLRDPSKRMMLVPADLHLELVTAPPQLALGSQLEFRGRRWGVTHRSVVEITAMEIGKRLIEEQRSGPFRQWKQISTVDVIDTHTTRITDEVTYEPPGGMLGLIVTAAVVERELTAFFAYRKSRLRELLGESSPI